MIDRVYKDNGGVIWVPNDYDSNKLRIFTAAHTGIGGHRAVLPTQKTIEPHFFWKKMENEIKSFVNSCLYCILSSPVRMVTRPYRMVFMPRSRTILYISTIAT